MRKPIRAAGRRASESSGEFLWLISLSDLMILLFVFFVVMFSFAYKRMGAVDFRQMSEALTGETPQVRPLDDVQAKLLKWVMDRKLLDSVEITQKQDALILQIKEKLLFDSGRSETKPESKELLGLISAALKKIPAPYRIGIEGHTDDAPSGSIDNWQLSSLRAHSVLMALQLDAELRQRAVIMAYGEMAPLLPNRDASGHPVPENQAKNRRVTIRIF